MTGEHRHIRWDAGRMPRPPRAETGFYKVCGDPWTTWTLVIARWEFYVARRKSQRAWRI